MRRKEEGKKIRKKQQLRMAVAGLRNQENFAVLENKLGGQKRQ